MPTKKKSLPPVIRSESAAVYGPAGGTVYADEPKPFECFTRAEQATIDAALTILERRLYDRGSDLIVKGRDEVERYMRLKLSSDIEQFGVLFLDNRHAIIAFEVVAKGTITSAAVYPRELVKAALRHNAAAIVICHNHPSGNPSPSEADKVITRKLRDIFDYIDVRLLDHVIIGNCTFSFAYEGLI